MEKPLKFCENVYKLVSWWSWRHVCCIYASCDQFTSSENEIQQLFLMQINKKKLFCINRVYCTPLNGNTCKSQMYIVKTFKLSLFYFAKNGNIEHFCLHQECDQVHVEDVASDDNGQELRCVTIYSDNPTATKMFFVFLLFKKCAPLAAATTTSWRTASTVPAVEEHRAPLPPAFKEEWSGCANWPFATVG